MISVTLAVVFSCFISYNCFPLQNLLQLHLEGKCKVTRTRKLIYKVSCWEWRFECEVQAKILAQIQIYDKAKQKNTSIDMSSTGHKNIRTIGVSRLVIQLFWHTRPLVFVSGSCYCGCSVATHLATDRLKWHVSVSCKRWQTCNIAFLPV